MLTLISFFLVVAGCINWLIIGLMQYDFIAGIFGTQSSLLSRLVYIAFGFSGVWFILMSFAQKGKIKINDNGFKRLNKALPAPNTVAQNNQGQENNSKKNQHKVLHSHQNHADNFQPYNEFDTPPHNLANQDAGEEFYQTNSNKRNPFD